LRFSATPVLVLVSVSDYAGSGPGISGFEFNYGRGAALGSMLFSWADGGVFTHEGA
jgi:hypothetical protein